MVTTMARLQTDWASIGLVDMFNAGGAIASETVVNVAVAGAGAVNGGEVVGETTSVEVMVSFCFFSLVIFSGVFFFFLSFLHLCVSFVALACFCQRSTGATGAFI